MKTSTTIVLVALFWILAGRAQAQNLVSVTLLSDRVQGGTGSVGRVTLDSPPGESALVTLSSSDTSDNPVASVPSGILVRSTTADFDIQTRSVVTTAQVTISATFRGVTMSAVLTVDPPPPRSSFRIGSFILTSATFDAWTWDPEFGRYTGVSGRATTTVTSDGMSTDLSLTFSGITIENPFELPTATAGSAMLVPSNPPVPVSLSGFTLHLVDLVLDPNQATATGLLQLPSSFTNRSGADCGGARIDLGSFSFGPDCEFSFSLAQAAFGPWSVGRLGGLELRGQGLDIDFSSTQSPLLLPAAFKGVVLRAGDTAEASTPPISNTGYLNAHYGFSSAVVGAAGLTAGLTLLDPFTFETLEPSGYRIKLLAGALSVTDGVFQGGSFTNLGAQFGTVDLPPQAVRDGSGNQATASYQLLEVETNFDLYGVAGLSGSLSLVFQPEGSFTGILDSNPTMAYTFGPFVTTYLYFSGQYRPAFRPVGPNGAFVTPPLVPFTNPLSQLRALGIGGLTVPPGTSQPANVEFDIRTPDMPFENPILTRADREDSWINVGGQGVHGEIYVLDLDPRNAVPAECTNPPACQLGMGPTEKSFYRKNQHSEAHPFLVDLRTTLDQATGHRYRIVFQFVDSAVYRSDASGAVWLGGPLGTSLDFTDLNFTSTAHCPGGKIQITNPVVLSYWNLALVPKPQTTSAGPLSVKTGQVFLVSAGIQEPRHFAKPFWINWAEVLASGELGRLVFDLDSSGQKFDGFDFTAEDLALSPYDPDNDPNGDDSYLLAAGTGHFDFFGADYLHLHDRRDANQNVPFNGRRIILSDGQEGTARPTVRLVSGSWGGDFMSASYRIVYNDVRQDGFRSDPGDGKDVDHLQFAWIDQPLLSSLRLDSRRVCLSAEEGFQVSDPSHEFTLGPLGTFGSMDRITGCACIVKNQLDRFHLEGESQGNADSLVLGAKGYVGTEMDLSGGVSEIWSHGDMLVNLIQGTAAVGVVGQAHFRVDRNHLSAEGDISGKIEAGTFLGSASGQSLGAEGQLGWLVSEENGDRYHAVQGRVAVSVVAPAGVAGIGLEGGFYFGENAPRKDAWILDGAKDPRYALDLQLPDRLTGVFGYMKFSESVDIFVLAGGYDIYAGMGGFLEGPNVAIVGHLRGHVWGKVLGGVASADGWADLQFLFDPPTFSDPQFQGKLGFKVCFLVLCADGEVRLLVDKGGVHLN